MLKVFATHVIAILGTEPACAAGGVAFIAEQWLRHIDGRAHVPAVPTEVLAGHG